MCDDSATWTNCAVGDHSVILRTWLFLNFLADVAANTSIQLFLEWLLGPVDGWSFATLYRRRYGTISSITGASVGVLIRTVTDVGSHLIHIQLLSDATANPL